MYKFTPMYNITQMYKYKTNMYQCTVDYRSTPPAFHGYNFYVIKNSNRHIVLLF